MTLLFHLTKQSTLYMIYRASQKKVVFRVICRFFKNSLEFYHKILHIYWTSSYSYDAQ